MDQDREEGEMSDDTEMLVDEEQPSIDNDTKSTLFYKADKNGIVIQQLKKVDASKLEERAERFGLNLSGNRVLTQKDIDELYSNFGIESGNERHFRFDTLHLNGVNGLHTKAIFEYLADYKPVSLEWIDDNSCNVVCQDHITAALALLVHSREIQNEEIKRMLLDKSSYHWREGMPHQKGDTILIRFATNSDKKTSTKKPELKSEQKFLESMNNPTKNPWGDLCRSWGVYDHQEIFHRQFPKIDYDDQIEEPPIENIQIKNKRLAMRLGKRNHKGNDEDSSDSDSEWKKKCKTPRMRMHADDEESKNVKRNTMRQLKEEDENKAYAPLSIEVINSRSTFTPRDNIISDKFKFRDRPTHVASKTIQSRLGAKVVRDKSSSGESSSDESEYNTRSRVQKVTNQSKNSVWSRLEAKKNSDDNDLRQILKTRKNKADKADDLRDKLSKPKQCNLRIEIDNSKN